MVGESVVLVSDISGAAVMGQMTRESLNKDERRIVRIIERYRDSRGEAPSERGSMVIFMIISLIEADAERRATGER